MTQTELWALFTDISSLDDGDKLLIKTASGSTAGTITAAQARAYLASKITPSIGNNGNWWMAGTDLGISAKGETPHLATDTTGVYYYLDSETSGTTITKHYLVNRSEFTIDLSQLTTTQYDNMVSAVADKVSAGVIKSSSYADGVLTLTV
jgi:hypothetical protein